MNEFAYTFLISLAVSAILDIITELLRYVRKSKCKLKLEYNDPAKSEAEIIPIIN